MNERIEKLTDKIWAEEYWNNPNTDKLLPAQLNKFAELIIQECIDCVRGAGLTDEVAVKNNLGFNDGLSAAVINVQKHFGVKE